ncbi:MAG TPA: VOC family protein [Candidatus Binatia bacterium]|nr:VOC family protein [Candidatus Binatia bacterium]
MLHAIDHLVIAVPDLAAAVATYRDLGFTVMPGGRHPGVGTGNALIVFRDTSYLELLGFYEPRPDHRWWTPLAGGGGLVDFCLQTDDLAADAKTLRQAGVEMGELERRDRRRPDGVEVRWVCTLARGAHRGVAPFLLAEDGPRDARVPRERDHANGVTGIGTVTVVVNDLAAARRWYGSVLGKPGEDLACPELGAVGARFTVGPHAFEFLAPAGAGPIRDWLAKRGPSPYSATLVGGHPPGPLDLARTSGARLALA